MKRIAIVILNYLNYEDTIECVKSIKDMQYNIVGTVIVDNGSNNESYEVIKGLYKTENEISVVKARKNYGFAKGNNIGISIARKRYQADFVYVVNNDVIFRDKSFFEKMLEEYDETVGIIGSKVVLRNEIVQPQWFSHVTLLEVINKYIRFWLVYKDREIWIEGLPKLKLETRKQMLHGCGLLFTPAYFEKYPGFYPRTFLYAEEDILYQICKRYNLKQKYVESTYIFHKEDQSSELSFQNNPKMKQKYTF